MPINTLMFDIQTIPDLDAGRRLYNLPDSIADEDVERVMATKRRVQTDGSEALPPHLLKIVAISIVRRHRDDFELCSIGKEDSTENELIRLFFATIAQYRPVLVSWNGDVHALPVLEYRTLINKIEATHCWGEQSTPHRGNTHTDWALSQKFGYMHTSLVSKLARFQSHAEAPLKEMTALLGIPCNLPEESTVFDTWLEQGGVRRIRHDCETRVLSTWLVYLRYQLMTGMLRDSEFESESQLVRDTLAEMNQPHLAEFLAAWPS